MGRSGFFSPWTISLIELVDNVDDEHDATDFCLSGNQAAGAFAAFWSS